MSERDELAAVIAGMRFREGTRRPHSSLEQADAILAAGYRKPRTITTAEELDALPDGSIILDPRNYCREAAKVSDGNIWRAMGPAKVRFSREIALPATVLHEPEQP